jgi:CRISPR/Cas system-associated exonuclease Cas4 (RecB family)
MERDSCSSTGGDLPLLPARMVNEFAYCPRLAYFEWVDGEFADNADTVEGRFHHRRVDHKRKARPTEEGESEGSTIHHRSVWLSLHQINFGRQAYCFRRLVKQAILDSPLPWN